MRIGSEGHKALLCQSFMESHRIYEPEILPWPQLDPTVLERLRGIPFWDEALYTEQKAGKMLDAYATTIADPMLREAIALQGREEARHGRVIAYLIDRYSVDIPIRPERELPPDLEPAFIRFGYGECFDSFFAFGLFAIARQAEAMPEAFFTIFDPILDEEARHMVFFVNWIAYKQVHEGKGWQRSLHSLWQYTGALQRRLDNLGSMGKPSGAAKGKTQKGFTATGAKSFMAGLTLEKFLAACLEENAKRMSAYDERLLRPDFLPILAQLGVNTLKLLPKRKPDAIANAT